MLSRKTIILKPERVTRLQCHLQEDIEDGTEVIFEPATGLDFAIAAAVDIVHDGVVTVQFANTSSQDRLIKPGTIIGSATLATGHADFIEEQGVVDMCHINTTADECEWLNEIDIGDQSMPIEERQNTKFLKAILRCFQQTP